MSEQQPPLSSSEQLEAISRAEAAIAKILESLERYTEMLVRDIRIVSADITHLKNNPRREYQQRIEIEMYRLPGHQW